MEYTGAWLCFAGERKVAVSIAFRGSLFRWRESSRPPLFERRELTRALVFEEGVGAVPVEIEGADRVVELSRDIIAEGSRSFAVASRLLSPETRHGAWMLYAWCRYCDDRVDDQSLGRGGPGPALAAGQPRGAAAPARGARRPHRAARCRRAPVASRDRLLP